MAAKKKPRLGSGKRFASLAKEVHGKKTMSKLASAGRRRAAKKK